MVSNIIHCNVIVIFIVMSLLSSLLSLLFSLSCYCYLQALREEQWQRAMDYVNAVSELNYMTQIVIMLYEDPNKVIIIPLNKVKNYNYYTIDQVR